MAGPFLTSISDLAATVVPGVLAASVTLVAEPGPVTPGFAGQLAWELDQQQYRLGGGPCLAAAVGGEDVDVVDARTDPRWRAYAAAAAARGSLSSLSVSLTTVGGPQAALNLYAGEVGAFTDPGARRVAARVAETAAAGLGALRGAERATARAEGLERAMDSRAVIEQAKGILMERRRVTAAAAFELLTTVSQHTNRKLRDVATQLVETGELPSS
ncbi:ANTAR domain-containing protein [Modestobacter italicus]|uniref:ANTAR domain-containing protein n=1 Tax=Modestobacter italicus (strain DSM 44449 / CECT 9708 / BC 501) TaxID=2732864 RepID=UPI0005A2808C|nr:ANTAR domain-containing protein [Modestobacter marinus]